MLGSVITLYYPGDGATEGSNSATYKGIKDFKVNTNGTITFKTQKHGTITSPCLWRLKENVDLEEEATPAAPVAVGGRARNQY